MKTMIRIPTILSLLFLLTIAGCESDDGGTTGPTASANGEFVDPGPTPGATHLPLDVQIAVGHDHDLPAGAALSYDVYLDTENASTRVAADLEDPRFIATELTPGARYYWRIVAKKDGQTILSPSAPWSFEVDFGRWDPDFDPPTLDGTVEGFGTDGSGHLLAMGDFEERIVAYEAGEWVEMTDGLPAGFSIQCTSEGSLGLFVGGSSSTTSDHKVYRLDGETWTPYSRSATDNGVFAMTEYNGKIWTNGDSFGGRPLRYIDSRDIWQYITDGTTSINVKTLTTGWWNPEKLIIGGTGHMGEFRYIADSQWHEVYVHGIGTFDGSDFISFGQGLSDGSVYAAAYQYGTGFLYAGGNFETSGETAVENIACWDGSFWQPLGEGLGGWVYSLIEYNGDIIAGGSFTKSGETDMKRLARWTGERWVQVGTDGVSRTPECLYVDHDGGLIVVRSGSSFLGSTSRVGRWIDY